MASRFDTDFFNLPTPRLFAHRGASGAYPENTMPAFQAACTTGIPNIELDIRMTHDEELIVIHDEDLERVAGQSGVVSEMTVAEVRRADAAFRFSADGVDFPFRGREICVPTLREVLNAFARQFFVIEIKQVAPSLVTRLLILLRETGMLRRVLIASEHQQPLDEVRRLAPAIPTNFSAHEVGQFVMSLPPGGPSFDPSGAALQIPPEHESWKLVTPECVDAAHRLGVEVHVWTVNGAAQMRELLALGVDGIISDYPALLLEVAGSV
jgi:glycerophosphoryl diester phosphodiesterase